MKLKTQVIELDDFGMAVWRHLSDRNLFVERSYRWVDHVIIIDEADGHRSVREQAKASEFDFREWVPVTLEQFRRVKYYFKEIYSAGFRSIDADWETTK